MQLPLCLRLHDAYGQLLTARGNFTDPHNHYTFIGKEWDEHLGLYEFGYRLYDPWAGLWLTREPLPGRAWAPRTWHRYQYAFASPISYYDPYGLQVPPPVTPEPVPTPPPYPPTYGPTPTPGPAPTPTATPAPGPSSTPTITPAPQPRPTAPRLPTPTPTSRAPAPAGAQCTPTAPSGYSPWAANAQALWILASWFFEIGPEVQWYGPESPFTQILKHHMGVQKARAEWAAAGYPSIFPPADRPPYHWRIEEAASTPWAAFFQENIKMLLSFTPFASPTPEGPINPLGGVVGSYEVIIDLGDGTALFMVENKTEWKSGTQIPGQPYGVLPELERSETDVLINLAVTTDVFLLPIVTAAPETIPAVLAWNRGMWELSRIVPGGWGASEVQ